MQIQINGEPTEITEEFTIAGLLEHLKIEPEQVAVEMNRQVVPRGAWDETTVREGAAIEIVRFVGGG
ncbi:MAG: sulfur carrier protein ThiS [Chrysiogenetes bacterium]|nr:sulfur carrier protein ThiS [Chrysiogenetes bacterium]